MTVLFVVMEFVPINNAGVYRPLRFINGLKKSGIDPVVVTFTVDENLKKIVNKFDFELENKLRKDITVYRIPIDDMTAYYRNKISKFWNIYFNITDNYFKAWRRNFNLQLPSIIKKHKPSLIIVTCPPFSAALLGMKISKKYGLPYILDMRDAWAELSMVPVGSRFHYIFKKRLQNKVFNQASYIITVTPQLKNIFKKSNPHVREDKFKLIFNTPEFPIERGRVSYEGILRKGICNVGYIGSFYYSPAARKIMLTSWWKRKGHRIFQFTPMKEDWRYRSPFFFFKTLKKVLERHPEWKDKLFFHHIGEIPGWLKEMILSFELQNNIILHGFKSYKNTISMQNKFDVLLTTSEKVINNPHYCLPSKLFTYIASQKPILGFVTEGIQADFIVNSGAGIVFDPDDEETGVKKFETFITDGYESSLNTNYLDKFSDRNAIKSLVEIINDTVKKTK